MKGDGNSILNILITTLNFKICVGESLTTISIRFDAHEQELSRREVKKRKGKIFFTNNILPQLHIFFIPVSGD